MPRYEFDLAISPEEYVEYYRGTRHVLARSVCGKAVQFPASLLQRFLTPEGIHGKFALICDERFSHARLERLPS